MNDYYRYPLAILYMIFILPIKTMLGINKGTEDYYDKQSIGDLK